MDCSDLAKNGQPKTQKASFLDSVVFDVVMVGSSATDSSFSSDPNNIGDSDLRISCSDNDNERMHDKREISTEKLPHSRLPIETSPIDSTMIKVAQLSLGTIREDADGIIEANTFRRCRHDVSEDAKNWR